MLAAIGIVIGVVAISSMGMLGTNMQLEVKEQLSSSANTIVITPDSVRNGSARHGAEFVFGLCHLKDTVNKDHFCCRPERDGYPDLYYFIAVYH